MPAPSEGFSERRGLFGLYELRQSWWRHRISFLLSLSITLFALSIYYLVILQEHRTPLFELAERLELDTLDTRFRCSSPQVLSPAPEALETHTYANDSGPAAADGHHVVTGWVVRVPVTLTPSKPWDIGGDRYPLRVSATYKIAGENRTFSARAAVDAQVARAIYEMGAASLILPVVCFGAAFRRWRRTR